MLSTISTRGQTAIPAEIRRRHGLKPNTRLQWIDDGKVITVVPVSDDPIASFRGRSRGKGLVAELLKGRQEERERERQSESHV